MLSDVECRNVGSGARLLRAELVAREEEETQAVIGVLTSELDQARHLLHVSQSRHVDHKDDLVRKYAERDLLSSIILGRQL